VGKYQPLGEFLRSRGTIEIPMNFSEIEAVIGTTLPPSASTQPAWWSNNPSNNVMTKVWLDAGFRTERLDLGGRKLVFRRRDKEPARAASQASRQGHHPAFGALRGTVTVAPDVDLTDPLDEPWGGEGG
jgi:hypothetical protein